MTRLLLFLLAATSLSACIQPNIQLRRQTTPTQDQTEAPEAAAETESQTDQYPQETGAIESASYASDDAFSTFGGTVITLGEEFTMYREPVGVAEVRALVVLGKTEWTIRIRGDGTEERKGTANFVVQRGNDAGNVRIQSGESGTVLGVTIANHAAGEVYEESSMRWVQYAKVTLTLEP